jgi:hypothetical protein
MVENTLEEVCRLVEAAPAPKVPSWPLPGSPAGLAAWADPMQVLLRGWSETFVIALQKLEESLGAEFEAAREAIAVGFRAAAARDPAELRARLAEFWQKSFDCLRPVTDLQLQAAQFAAALGLHVAGGMEKVGEATYRERMAVCEACLLFWNGRCLKCGCRLEGDVVAKARWARERCPLGKWPR